MHRPIVSRHLAAGLLAVAALVAACGSTNTASPSPAAPGGTSVPASAGAAASAGDAVLDVRIGQPYALADLPAATADTIQAGIEKDLGAFGKAVHVTVRAIQQSGTVAAYLMVVAFPRGTLSETVYAQVLTTLSMGSESDYAPRPIRNVPVSFGTMGGGSVAVFRHGDNLLIALSPTTADLTPVATALVAANG